MLANNEFLTDSYSQFMKHYEFVKNDFGEHQVVKGAMFNLVPVKDKESITALIQELISFMPKRAGMDEVIVLLFAHLQDLYINERGVFLYLNTSHASPELQSLVQTAFSTLAQYRHQLIGVDRIKVLINGDNEAYNFTPHPAPYAARSYVTIRDYIPTDCIDERSQSEVMKKMENNRCFLLAHVTPSGISCNCREECQRAVLNHITWQFESSCPCAAANHACSPDCYCRRADAPVLASLVTSMGSVTSSVTSSMSMASVTSSMSMASVTSSMSMASVTSSMSVTAVKGERTALQPGLLQQIFSQAGQPTQSHQSPNPTLPSQSRPYAEDCAERKPARECHNQIGDFDSLAVGK